MRVAITVLVALAALAGPIPALAACSSSTGGGSSSPITTIPKKIVNPVLELVGLPPLGSSTTSNTTNITNNTTNVTNNFFTTVAQEPTDQNATTTSQTPTKSAGGGGGGGGGFGGLGGGFSGSSSAGGSPINPSSESSVQMFAGGGSSSGGGGTVNVADPITLASLSPTPNENAGSIVMASADPSGQPGMPSIALATLPAPTGGTDDLMAVAMASPKTAQPASGEGFGFEGPASGSTAPTSGYAGTTMLAALIGVGMLGAGWAWRSL
jgi:hypothetical protein